VFVDSCRLSQSVLHELEPSLDSAGYSSSDFLWSKYFSLIGERSVSDEFFDHYLASIESGLEIDMKLEYCYDLQRDLYWLTQIQLVSHSLMLLHYVGLPDDDTTHDFWAYLYEQRCHPIGWCREHSKLMLPPPIFTKRAIQQAASSSAISTLTAMEYDKHTVKNKDDNADGQQASQTPPIYLFDKVTANESMSSMDTCRSCPLVVSFEENRLDACRTVARRHDPRIARCSSSVDIVVRAHS
jgi:hypothetical protein